VHLSGVVAEPVRVRKTEPAEGRDGRSADRAREWVARAFTRLEDVVYVGLSLLLAGTALVLLATGLVEFVRLLAAGTLPGSVVDLLDRVLLILIFVEVLYTVQVSFREHALVPEPFLIVGLIAGIRRVLVLTAELSKMIERGEEAFRNALLELALLTALIVALVGSLMLLRRRPSHAVADRA
jgi:uncharacterized membrane protein (DUF373 family)